MAHIAEEGTLPVVGMHLVVGTHLVGTLAQGTLLVDMHLLGTLLVDNLIFLHRFYINQSINHSKNLQ